MAATGYSRTRVERGVARKEVGDVRGGVQEVLVPVRAREAVAVCRECGGTSPAVAVWRRRQPEPLPKLPHPSQRSEQ